MTVQEAYALSAQPMTAIAINRYIDGFVKRAALARLRLPPSVQPSDFSKFFAWLAGRPMLEQATVRSGLGKVEEAVRRGLASKAMKVTRGRRVTPGKMVLNEPEAYDAIVGSTASAVAKGRHDVFPGMRKVMRGYFGRGSTLRDILMAYSPITSMRPIAV